MWCHFYTRVQHLQLCEEKNVWFWCDSSATYYCRPPCWTVVGEIVLVITQTMTHVSLTLLGTLGRKTYVYLSV